MNYVVDWGGFAEKYPDANSSVPTDSTSFVIASNNAVGQRTGALIYDTKGKYISSVRASAWYNITRSSIGSPAIEYRYFAYDIETKQKTQSFQINYEHQWVSSYIGVLRKYEYSTYMPVNYQLKDTEILGFTTVLHTHGGGGDYDYEFHFDSTNTPSLIKVEYSVNNTNTYYIKRFYD